MNTPTKEQRDKINEAIDKVTNLCASGNTTPSKAVAKVASAMHLTDDYLPIIVRAYNTGAATIHRENSHSLQEKVASYPIANLDEVRSILQREFPLNKKAAVEAPRDTFWEYNANYHFPNAWAHLEAGLDPEFWDVKQASVKQCTVARDRVRSNVASTAERAATEATRIKYAAVEELNQAVADLESILCKAAGITLDTARDYASAVYGDTGLSVINKLIQSNNLEKTARYRKETYIPTTHPFAKAFDKFVLKNEQVKKASKEEKEVVTQCLNTVNELVRPKDRYVADSDSIDAMLKEGEMCRRKKDLRKHYEKKKEEFLKEAYRPLSESGVGGISGLEQLNHPGWVGLDRFERELMYGLADPAHEAKLRNIRVQTILTDLMNTDPYLKDKDPEEVIDAMNDIMEINPDLHKNKPMLRLALRQYMESGGMDIPTLGVLSEFGKEERERKSRERSQAESSAQQFASQQESARQADEKLRSEEMRANNELELKKKEYELKEKEFAKKYPELEEHKGLVRRLVSMGMSLGEIAHNIRHPLQATNEAFTREWTREQRKRNLDRNEEDTELSKREAEQRGTHNDLMRAILDEGKLNIDIRNIPQDEAAYQQEKTMKQRRTDQEFNDLDEELKKKHNQTLAGALNSEEDLGKAQNRHNVLTDILASDIDALQDQLEDAAQEHRNAADVREIKQLAHDKKMRDAIREQNNLGRIINIENKEFKQDLLDAESDLKNRPSARKIKERENKQKRFESDQREAHKTELQDAFIRRLETDVINANSGKLNAMKNNDSAQEWLMNRSRLNNLSQAELEKEIQRRQQKVNNADRQNEMDQQDFDEKSWQYTERKNNEKELQQAFRDSLGAQVNEAGTRFVNAYINNLEATARYNAIIDKKNKAKYQAALDRKAINDIKMFNDQNSEDNLKHNLQQQQWTNQKNYADAVRNRQLSRIQDQAAYAKGVTTATKAIDDFRNKYHQNPESSINPVAPDPTTGEPGILYW